MDVGTIRSRYIQSQLRRALRSDEDSLALKALVEFRRYFEWFLDSIPAFDRWFISYQLRQLEQRCRTNRAGDR
jgi:hypothetical protein